MHFQTIENVLPCSDILGLKDQREILLVRCVVRIAAPLVVFRAVSIRG